MVLCLALINGLPIEHAVCGIGPPSNSSTGFLQLQPSAVPTNTSSFSAAVNGTVTKEPWDVPSNRPLYPGDSLATTEKLSALVNLHTLEFPRTRLARP